MAGSERILRSGVAVVTVGEWNGGADLDGFVEQVSHLVQDRDDVRRVYVRAADDPPHALRYLVRALDGQARIFGKSVDFSPPSV